MYKKNSPKFLLHAPNVNVGGGAVLLQELFMANNLHKIWANLDQRIAKTLIVSEGVNCNFVKPSILDRFKAELKLLKKAQDGDVILCLHSMPPIFAVRGKVIVYHQNKLLLSKDSLRRYPAKTRLRLIFERFISYTFKNHVHEYIVQTPTMQSAVKEWHGGNPMVRVIPFMGVLDGSSSVNTAKEVFDFVYVADGESHKNHRNLLAAWVLLAQEGIFPSLGLTLPDRCVALRGDIDNEIKEHGLLITNLGTLPHDTVMNLYRTAKALMFPSTAESFGLPLLEATSVGLPIVASELDYVRDVCSPVHTFNPVSPVSIARAVKRFLNIPADPIQIRTAAEFLGEIGL